MPVAKWSQSSSQRRPPLSIFWAHGDTRNRVQSLLETLAGGDAVDLSGGRRLFQRQTSPIEWPPTVALRRGQINQPGCELTTTVKAATGHRPEVPLATRDPWRRSLDAQFVSIVNSVVATTSVMMMAMHKTCRPVLAVPERPSD